MNQEQVTPQTILVSARRSVAAGHIVPPVARHMGMYETLESLVPFNHSMPTAAEYADLWREPDRMTNLYPWKLYC